MPFDDVLKAYFIVRDICASVNVHLYMFLRVRVNSDKANLRDLIAATGLVILLKLDSNNRFFGPRDLEI